MTDPQTTRKRMAALSLTFWCAYSVLALEWIWLKDTFVTPVLATYFCVMIVWAEFKRWRDV